MWVKRIGVELALMAGARPRTIALQVRAGAECTPLLPMRRDHLPVAARLLPEQARLLALDKRKRGEHRPLRLLLGRFNRMPYTYYSTALPLAAPPLAHAMQLVLWLELYDAMFPYAPLFHFKGCEPRTHPLTHRVHWVEHRHWTLADCLGRPHLGIDETPCGCGVRVNLCLAPPRTVELVQPCISMPPAAPCPAQGTDRV